MKGDVLDTEQVVAVRESGWEGEFELLLARGRPLQARGIHGRLLLVDLEPVLAAGIEGGSGGAGRRLCHIHEQRTGVDDGRVELETDGGTSLHRGRGGGWERVDLIATQRLRGDVRDGTVAVVVRRHTDILVLAGSVVVGDEVGECVVGRGSQGRSQKEQASRSLHNE